MLRRLKKGEGRCLRETKSERPKEPTGVDSTICLQKEMTGNWSSGEGDAQHGGSVSLRLSLAGPCPLIPRLGRPPAGRTRAKSELLVACHSPALGKHLSAPDHRFWPI